MTGATVALGVAAHSIAECDAAGCVNSYPLGDTDRFAADALGELYASGWYWYYHPNGQTAATYCPDHRDEGRANAPYSTEQRAKS